MIYVRSYNSPLGSMTMTGDDKYLTGLYFDEHEHIQKNSPMSMYEGNKAVEKPDFKRIERYNKENAKSGFEEKLTPVFRETIKWLDIYFGGEKPDFMPPVYFKDTDFREGVWRLVMDIPYGELRTYGDLARDISIISGKGRMSAQAVGQAVGRNNICLVIPCHRVIAAGGAVGGYGGQVERKIELLKLEGHKISGDGRFVLR